MSRHWKDRFQNDRRSDQDQDQDHRLKSDRRSDQKFILDQDHRSFFAPKVHFLRVIF
jgi:hypothetical protein